MKPNLWIYANSEEQNRAASSMIVFGAQVFHKAKIIKNIELLEEILAELDNSDKNAISPLNKEIIEFGFEYLVDCIRILIFFENYMKAELIIQNFCVHTINKELEKFKFLSKEQFKRPINLTELADIEAFKVFKDQKLISHNAVNHTTLGFKVLTGSPNYLKCYQLNNSIINYVRELNGVRNNLHFNDRIEFALSHSFIEKMKTIIEFVNKTIHERIRDRPQRDLVS